MLVRILLYVHRTRLISIVDLEKKLIYFWVLNIVLNYFIRICITKYHISRLIDDVIIEFSIFSEWKIHWEIERQYLSHEYNLSNFLFRKKKKKKESKNFYIPLKQFVYIFLFSTRPRTILLYMQIHFSFRTWMARRRRTWRLVESYRNIIGRYSRCRFSWWATCCHWCWYASFTFACSSGSGAPIASVPKAVVEENESRGWSSSSLAFSPFVGALYRLVSLHFPRRLIFSLSLSFSSNVTEKNSVIQLVRIKYPIFFYWNKQMILWI